MHGHVGMTESLLFSLQELTAILSRRKRWVCQRLVCQKSAVRSSSCEVSRCKVYNSEVQIMKFL